VCAAFSLPPFLSFSPCVYAYVCVWPAKHHGGSHVEILIPRPLNLLTIPILLHLLLLCRSLSGTQKWSPHAGDYIFEYIYTHICIYTPKKEEVGDLGCTMVGQLEDRARVRWPGHETRHTLRKVTTLRSLRKSKKKHCILFSIIADRIKSPCKTTF